MQSGAGLHQLHDCLRVRYPSIQQDEEECPRLWRKHTVESRSANCFAVCQSPCYFREKWGRMARQRAVDFPWKRPLRDSRLTRFFKPVMEQFTRERDIAANTHHRAQDFLMMLPCQRRRLTRDEFDKPLRCCRQTEFDCSEVGRHRRCNDLREFLQGMLDGSLQLPLVLSEFGEMRPLGLYPVRPWFRGFWFWVARTLQRPPATLLQDSIECRSRILQDLQRRRGAHL